MFTLLGIEVKQGSGVIEGVQREWDNYIFHLCEVQQGESSTLKKDGDFIGQRVLVEKCPRELIPVEELPQIGFCYEIYYNKRGKLTKFVPA